MPQLKYTANAFPNKEQEQYLSQVLGCTRKVWNIFLDKEITTYQNTGKFNFYNKNCVDLTQLKKTEEYS